jgi:hypothetical protein
MVQVAENVIRAADTILSAIEIEQVEEAVESSLSALYRDSPWDPEPDASMLVFASHTGGDRRVRPERTPGCLSCHQPIQRPS